MNVVAVAVAMDGETRAEGAARRSHRGGGSCSGIGIQDGEDKRAVRGPDGREDHEGAGGTAADCHGSEALRANAGDKRPPLGKDREQTLGTHVGKKGGGGETQG